MPGLLVPIRRECDQCGKQYEARSVRSHFCSRECKEATRRSHEKAKRLALKKDAPRFCTLCGRQLPPESRSDKKFCSEGCTSAARMNLHRAARRMRITVAGELKKVPRVAIYERDQWICQLCDKPIDRELRYPDPMCASIDHVVPISMGGSNSAENLQATHHLCNTSAGNKKPSDSLRPAPVWLGVEYCSAQTAATVLDLPYGRIRHLLETGTIPALDRRPRQDWRIPISFVDEILAVGIPEEFLVDGRLKPDREPKPTHRKLTCVYCGRVDLVPVSLTSGRRFCSEACYKAAKNQRRRLSAPREPIGKASKLCVICGQQNPVSNGAYRSLLCGKPACRNEHTHRRLVKKRQAERGEPSCKNCGKHFALRERGSGRQLRYCSDDCREEAARSRAREQHRKNRTRRSIEGKKARLDAKKQNPRVCVVCGTSFPPETRADKRYCDRSCWNRRSQQVEADA